MSARQYIGARYVPKFYEGSAGTDWIANTQYEPLTIVTRNGNSYTSKKAVPASVGAPESNPDYWASTGNYNAYIGELAEEISEVRTDLQNTETSVDTLNKLLKGYVNVLTLGCKNDGTEDCSAIINANSDKPLYFPAGLYRIDNTLTLSHSIIGEGFNRSWKPDHFSGTILNFTMDDGSNAIEYTGDLNEETVDIGNISIQLNPANTGDGLVLNTGNNLFYVHDLHIIGVNKRGIYAAPTALSSRYIYAFNVEIWGVYRSPNINSVGIETGSLAVDCRFVNITIQSIHFGMVLRGNVASVVNSHVWSGANTSDEEYWSTCVAFDVYANNVKIINSFLDSYHVLVHTGIGGKLCSLNDCYAYWDTSRTFSTPPAFFVLAESNAIADIVNLVIQCPYNLFYLSNKPNEVHGDIIINGYGNYTTFNFARALRCNSYYNFDATLDTESYVEVARMGVWASVLINCDLWTCLVSATATEVKYTKINTGLDVFYKIVDGYFKIYMKVPAGTRPIMCKPITKDVIDKTRNLFGMNSLTYEILTSADGLTAATLTGTINGTPNT